MANSSPLRRATRPAVADLRPQSLGNGAQHQIAVGVAEHVVDLLEPVETEHQQRDLACSASAPANHRGESGVERVAVGEPGQRVVLGEIADLLRFALAHRDVAQDRAILEAVGALPAGEAGLDRKYLAVACGGPRTRSPAPGERVGRRSRIENGDASALPAQIASNGWPIISSALIAEDRGRRRVPHRDQVVRSRCRPGRRRATSRCAGSGSRRCGRAGREYRFRRARWRRDRPRSAIWNSEVSSTSGKFACSSKAAASTADRRCDEQRRRRMPAERRRHASIMASDQHEQARPSVTAVGRPVQRAVLQDRFGRQRLQHRAGDNAAVRNAEAVAELERGAADDDLLALQPAQRRRIAAQHVDVGDLRDRGGADAEIDQERRALAASKCPASTAPIEGRNSPSSFSPKRIAAHQPVRLDRDIDDRGPGLVAELLQRAVEMGRRRRCRAA